MSRILRRPMFRGGPVSSYGTGIAHGLGERNRVNMFEGGWPHWAIEELQSGTAKKPNISSGQTTGGQILNKAKKGLTGKGGWRNFPMLSSSWRAAGIPSASTVGMMALPFAPTAGIAAMNMPKTTEGLKFMKDAPDWTFDETNLDVGDWYEEFDQKNKEGEEISTLDAFLLDPGTETYPWWIGRYEDLAKREAIKKADAEAKEIKTEPGDTEFKEKNVDNNTGEPEVTPEVDAKTMVAENKELFRDLLGYDKAKGQDISEMLLGFAGAEGDDTWSKAKSFFRDEAKRPGKAQKIDETAAALAINDYIAGKRSKEQIQKLKEIESWKLDEQLKKVYPQADDKWIDAVTKAAGKDDSFSSDKTLKKALAPRLQPNSGTSDAGKNLFTGIEKKDLEDIRADQEDFDIGLSIVTLKDPKGKKVIVEKTETDIKIRTDLPIF